jgi:hypothetical protein
MNEKDKRPERGFNFNYKLLVTIAAILTPLTYLVGVTYFEGMLRAYMIEPKTFPLNTDAVYLYAYRSVGEMLLLLAQSILDLFRFLSQIPWILLPLIVIAIGIHYAGRKWNSSEYWTGFKQYLEGKLSGLIQGWDKQYLLRSVTVAGIAIYAIYALLTVLIALTFVWWAAPALSEYIAYTSHKESRQKYEKLGCCFEYADGWSVSE